MLNVGSNNISFKSNPLGNVHLRKVKNGVVQGSKEMVFSELSQIDKVDIQAIKEIGETWKRPDLSLPKAYSQMFLGDEVSPDIKYYAIESPHKNKKLSDKIVAFMKLNFYPEDENLELAIVQSHPDLMLQDKKERSLKGCGEILLGKTFDFAKQNKTKTVQIGSSNNAFYYKTFKDAKVDFHSFLRGNIRDFIIFDKEFDKYINYINQKYRKRN